MERKILHPGFLDKLSQVNIRTRNIKILPMLGLQNNEAKEENTGSSGKGLCQAKNLLDEHLSCQEAKN